MSFYDNSLWSETARAVLGDNACSSISYLTSQFDIGWDDDADRHAMREQLIAEVWGLADPV